MLAQGPNKRLRSKAPEQSAEASPSDSKYSDAMLKGQVTTYFTRFVTGKVKKAGDEEVANAKEALATFSALDEGEKVGFAQAFAANKSTKSFGFIRDYSEKVKATKSVTEVVKEKYMTRT